MFCVGSLLRSSGKARYMLITESEILPGCPFCVTRVIRVMVFFGRGVDHYCELCVTQLHAHDNSYVNDISALCPS